MSEPGDIAAFDGFIEAWRTDLEQRAFVRFETGTLPHEPLTPVGKADAFAQSFGFQPIGFNWEMLDPGRDMTAPRSARATLVEALSKDLARPSLSWLSEDRALACADEFLSLFEEGEGTILTNHLNGLWYPISGASDEWSFVGMDTRLIVLLVLASRP
ncbi:MAG: hypothetical protein AAF559_03570 [Pseudomonadota bacterium]